jgi:hypothetical protein
MPDAKPWPAFGQIGIDARKTISPPDQPLTVESVDALVDNLFRNIAR